MYKNLLKISKKIKKLANKGRFLNFNKDIEGVETNSYITQPGYGHPQPSGQIALNETGQGINIDKINETYNLTENGHNDYPVGENNKPKGYRGPHNDREVRRMPVQTIDNVIPPRGVPR